MSGMMGDFIHWPKPYLLFSCQQLVMKYCHRWLKFGWKITQRVTSNVTHCESRIPQKLTMKKIFGLTYISYWAIQLQLVTLNIIAYSVVVLRNLYTRWVHSIPWWSRAMVDGGYYWISFSLLYFMFFLSARIAAFGPSIVQYILVLGGSFFEALLFNVIFL